MSLKLDLDIEQFWKDDELAHKDNCFSSAAPQVAFGIRMSHECVFSELGVEGHPWDAIDPIRQAELNKRYNDKAEKIVGRRLLPEKYTLPEEYFPEVKRIGEVFGSRYEYFNHSEWLHRCCETPEDIEKEYPPRNSVRGGYLTSSKLLGKISVFIAGNVNCHSSCKP